MKKAEQPRGLLYHFQGVPWNWFGTFTFGLHKRPDVTAPGRFLISTKRPPSRPVRYSMFFQWLISDFQKQARLKQTVLVLRHELGERGSRPHFHFLMVVPDHMKTISHRFRMMSAWEKRGGGFARIRPVTDSRAARIFSSYVSKASPAKGLSAGAGADKYESNKFEQSDWEDLYLSPALMQFLADR